MKILKVLWQDAVGDDDPRSMEDLINADLIGVSSIGYLVKEYDNRIILASTIFLDDNSVRHWIVIPKAMIIKKGILEDD